VREELRNHPGPERVEPEEAAAEQDDEQKDYADDDETLHVFLDCHLTLGRRDPIRPVAVASREVYRPDG
jgi:hypothetical protein